MGLLQRLIGRRTKEIVQTTATPTENRMQLTDGAQPPLGGFAPKAGWKPQDYLPPTVGTFFNVGRQDAGINVDELVGLTANAVYSCVNIIAGTMSVLPLNVVEVEDQIAQPLHPLARVLSREPNEFMTAATFWGCMLTNLLLYGHCNAFIEKDDMGVPINLYPLRSAVTRPIRLFGELLYVTLVGTTFSYLRPDQIFSVVNAVNLDGITPIGPIQEQKQAVGLSLALEKFAAKFFSNNGSLGGVLKLPPGMKEGAIENFVASWKKNYSGPDNALKVAMLPDGYNFIPTTTEPIKAQALEARVNQLREVARIYRVPLHKLADLERATFSNIEQLEIEFQQDCILPWAVRIEQEAERKLLLEREKGRLNVKFDLDSMLRADSGARYAAYTAGRQGGWLTVNEIRKKEGLPPVPGGDTLLQPLNMVPVAHPALPKPEPTVSARTLIEDTAKRILTKECKALARAAKKFQGKPDELRVWAEQWYTGHADLVARQFAAPMQAAGLTTSPADFAKTHCAESIRSITAAGATLDDITDTWTDIRPSEIADALTTARG